jgi:hypothetical protein
MLKLSTMQLPKSFRTILVLVDFLVDRVEASAVSAPARLRW